MKFFLYIFFCINISNVIFANNLYNSDEYIIKFSSDNINIYKEKKIDEVKISSFNKIINKVLDKKNFNLIKNKINIKFVNKFILNIRINEEKIVENNYFSKIKISFDKKLITNYFIANKINFIDFPHPKFLILIYEESNLGNNLLSKKNNYYNFLINSSNLEFSEYFLVPELNYNDRFIFNEDYFKNNNINQLNEINKKYNTEYQIIIHSTKTKTAFHVKIYFYDNKNIYFINENNIDQIKFDKFFLETLFLSLNKWKNLNNINTNIKSNINCKIYINNISELKFVRNIFDTNMMIYESNLKSIQLNQNLYNIVYYGDLNIFKKSLNFYRLNLNYENDLCTIKLI